MKINFATILNSPPKTGLRLKTIYLTVVISKMRGQKANLMTTETIDMSKTRL